MAVAWHLKPAGHGVHVPDAAALYLPVGHVAAVGDVEPSGHQYPAAHTPLQRKRGRVVEPPHRPGLHFTHAVWEALKEPRGQEAGFWPDSAGLLLKSR
jgi:hypothetical protein